MKITNKEIKFNIIENGKIIKSSSYSNRILDNYFKFMLDKIFISEKASLFPTLPLWSIDTLPTQFCYLNFTATQTINDNADTMTYDEKLNLTDIQFITTETGSNFFNVSSYYEFTIPAEYDNSLLYGVGFGQDDSLSAWLLAFLDTEDVGITLVEGQILQIVRVDTISCDGVYTRGTTTVDDIGSFPFHLGFWPQAVIGGASFWGELVKIGFAFNGVVYKEYNISDLTLTYSNVGEVTISGFDNFRVYDGPILYPSTTLYPSATLYPTPQARNFTKVIFTYNIYRYIDPVLDVYDTYTITKPIGEQSVILDNKAMTIKYKYERGDE